MDGFTKILGMRRAESLKRSKYKCFNAERSMLLPIIDWQDSDIWQYVSERPLKVCSLYSQGFTRIGCVLCTFTGKDEIRLSMFMFPKIVRNWRAAAIRYFDKQTQAGKVLREDSFYHTGEEYFNWWIAR